MRIVEINEKEPTALMIHPYFNTFISKAVSDSKWATLTNPTRARTRTPPKMNQVGPKVGPKNDQKMESISVPFELVCNEFAMKRSTSFKNKHNFLFCLLNTKLLLNYLLKPCRESFQSDRQRYCSFWKSDPWSSQYPQESWIQTGEFKLLHHKKHLLWGFQTRFCFLQQQLNW